MKWSSSAQLDWLQDFEWHVLGSESWAKDSQWEGQLRGRVGALGLGQSSATAPKTPPEITALQQRSHPPKTRILCQKELVTVHI